jgi:hypothetical protein
LIFANTASSGCTSPVLIGQSPPESEFPSAITVAISRLRSECAG